MIRKIILACIHIIEKITGKTIILVDKSIIQKNNTAAISAYGFWYVGNVYNMADLAYGIATKGVVEKEETKLVKSTLDYMTTHTKTKKITFYDIGANSGYYGILSAFLYKDSQTYSFEPLTEYADCIRKSAYLNRLENIFIFENGVGNINEEKTMHLAGTGSSFEEGFSGNDTTPKRTIKIKKLDDMVKDENITLPDFIKIDVEGHELKVLRGAEKTIKKNLPVMFIEIASSLKKLGKDYVNKDCAETFNLLREIGYVPYILSPNGLHAIEDTASLDPINMYLFLHTDAHTGLKDHLIK